jgi:hypothetical protein
VQCVNTADRIIEPLNEAACAGVNSTAEAKPPTMQTCGRSACATFQPVAKDWSSCSVTCGGGVQTRSVYCVDQRSRSVVRSSFCDLSSVPTSQPCNTDGCALVAGANWQQGNWSECSTECGGGYRTRQVQCVSAGTVVDSAQCKATMPATQDSCSIDPCGTYWYAGAWSTCTQACGEAGGTQSRTVSCLRTSDDPATATPLDASLCSNSRPSDTAVCNQNPCPTYVASDEWSPCSARCDEGLQTRNVTCQAYDGRVLDQSFCAGAPMPQVQRVCVDMQCPHWHRGEWGLCSQNCGGGSHNRSLVCRMPHDETYHGVAQPDTTLCPPPGVGDVGDGVGMPGVAAVSPTLTD